MIERIEINLLPAEYRIRKKTIKISRAVVYSALVLVIFALALVYYTYRLANEKAELQASIDTVNREIQANRHVQAEINQMRAQKNETEQKVKALEQISVDREKWVKLLEVLSGSLPTHTWLLSIREEGTRLNIEARTFSFSEVAHYMSRLEESELIESVELTVIERISGGDRERQLYRFTIICTLSGGPVVETAEASAAEEPAAGRSRRARGGE